MAGMLNMLPQNTTGLAPNNSDTTTTTTSLVPAATLLPSSTVWWANLSGLNETPTSMLDAAGMVGCSPVLM